MKTVKIGKHTVELYDTIEELPVTRFHKYQKRLLVDCGIGSTIEDFDKHIEKARRFLMFNDPANAQKELENLRQCVFMVQAALSPQHLAFACLVVSIDGTKCEDLTDDSLKNVVDILADSPCDELTDQLRSVKKKIDAELMVYFPKLYEDSDAKEFFDKVRRRTLLVLKNIVAGVPVPDGTKDVDDITTELITYTHPQIFAGSESIEIKFDRQFENLCLMLSGQLNVKPKEYTVLDFYNAFEFLKEKAAKQARTRR